MGEDIDEVIVRVRADTAVFARDVATMRGELEGPLANGVARAGRVIEGALSRAVTSGKFGFDDLKRVALSAMSEIASTSLRGLFAPQGGGGSVLPSLGGSLPLYLIRRELGAATATLGLWNHDNNQHAEDENVRIESLLNGIAAVADLMTMR